MSLAGSLHFQTPSLSDPHTFNYTCIYRCISPPLQGIQSTAHGRISRPKVAPAFPALRSAKQLPSKKPASSVTPPSRCQWEEHGSSSNGASSHGQG